MYFHQPVNCQLESIILVAGDKLKVRLLAVYHHSIVIKLVAVAVDSNSSGQLPGCDLALFSSFQYIVDRGFSLGELLPKYLMSC